jgi:hypothetical protein
MSRAASLALLGIALCGGCASFQTASGPMGDEPVKAAGEKKEDKKEEEKKPPKTMFEWNIGKKEEDKNAKDKGGDQGKNGKDKDAANGGNGGKNGKASGDNSNDGGDQSGSDNGNSGDQPPTGDEEKKRIDPDRPHLPEASTTVGLGRAVLEAGYTYNTSGGFFPLHSYPEALLRIGVCAEWLELRIAQNVTSQTVDNAGGGRSTESGPTDLQLGLKLALTEQQKCLPESALILQMTVPTGNKEVSSDRVLPGVHYNCTWEIIKDFLSVETVLIADGSVDDNGHTFTQFGDGVTAACDLTKKLEAFGELDSFYAAGDSAPPQHYFVAGLVYFITDNCEIDVRAGVGLNHNADGYLIGSGFAIRY